MKRPLVIGTLIGVLAGLLLVAMVATAGQMIRLVVNGQEVQADIPPQMIDGHTMVPVRFVAEALGDQVGWDGTTHTVTISSASSSTTQYYFPRAGQDADGALDNVINSAHSTLDVAIYSITKDDIVAAIIAAEKRGVAVRLITDKTEAANRYEAAALAQIEAAGIPIKVNSHSGLMHLKVTIADDRTLTTGSYNYSNSATHENDEVLVVITNPTMAQAWDDEFNAMWNDTSRFRDYQ